MRKAIIVLLVILFEITFFCPSVRAEMHEELYASSDSSEKMEEYDTYVYDNVSYFINAQGYSFPLDDIIVGKGIALYDNGL